MLGADGPGKAEARSSAWRRLRAVLRRVGAGLHGGELTGAVQAGLVHRERRHRPRRACCAGEAPGRPGADAVTLFDSTGLAIQDLAVAAAALQA